jgi:hypothetical protein
MTFLKKNPMSIEDVREKLRRFEDMYSMTTSTFAALTGRCEYIDEVDAMEWDFAIEQWDALRAEELEAASQVARAYLHTSKQHLHNTKNEEFQAALVA